MEPPPWSSTKHCWGRRHPKVSSCANSVKSWIATSQFKLREYMWSRLLNVEFSTIVLFLPNHNHLQHEHEQLTSNVAGDATSTYAPDVTCHPARPASAFSTLPSRLSQTASTTMRWYSRMYPSSIAVRAVDNPSPPRLPQFPWMLYVTSADGQRGWYGHASTISDTGDAPPPPLLPASMQFLAHSPHSDAAPISVWATHVILVDDC